MRRQTRLVKFLRFAGQHTGARELDYAAAHAWSVEHPEEFWSAVWSFCDVIGARGEPAVEAGADMVQTRFFPNARMNFAENLLRNTGHDDAIVALTEDGQLSRLSWDDLRSATAACRESLEAMGMQAGDRLAVVLPNTPEAVVALLGASALGMTFSSASPDFGERGLLDRFGQIQPRMLIGCNGYRYNGKLIDTRDKLIGLAAQLPSVEHIVMLRCVDFDLPDQVMDWQQFLAGGEGAPLNFAQLPFDHPLCIVFSSGTTGMPKCIVHRAGGVLLQHLKEQQLHCDIGSGDRVFYFTTCGWMMWNWLVSALASGASICLYDGSPSYPDAYRLFKYAEQEQISFFGTSAKFLDTLRKADIEPKNSCDLSSIRTLASTGSPLSASSFDFVYESIKSDVHLASISGGTDLLACFVGGNPCAPVYRGQIQAPMLGMAVEVWDDGGSRLAGVAGELICTRAFPSMPLGFWGDPGQARYLAAYFKRFPGVWCHGDLMTETPQGGYVMLGRSDTVLNPGGVRIGTAEIYRCIEAIEEILESVAVGQAWQDDQRVVLFVVMRDEYTLDAELKLRIRRQIRQAASPRHVPARIVAVPGLPRTLSGKLSEFAVRETIHGRPVKNLHALANPEIIKVFENRKELSS